MTQFNLRLGTLYRSLRSALSGGSGPSGARLTLGAVLLTFALLPLGSGCNSADDEAVASPLSPEATFGTLGDLPSAFALSDLPAEMKLTPDQSARLSSALETLAAERRERADSWSERRARFGKHQGRGGRTDGGQDGRSGPRDWFPRGHEGGKSSPMIGFLEESSKILEPDQFLVLARFLDQRRESRRSEVQAFMGRHGARGLDRMARHLGLDATQQTGMRDLLERHAEGVRDIATQLEAGSMTAEQARARSRELRESLRTSAQSILTPDQYERIHRFRGERLARQIEHRVQRMDEQMMRRADFLGRVLGLSDEQTSRVRAVLEETISQRQTTLRNVGAGSLEPEDAALELWETEKATAERIRPLLTTEQQTRMDALLDLLPRGLRFGGRLPH
ncbi:MAG: hypothetical protein IT349_05175 [Candidatus Eisenbacteria bacterium]|nr:hypothetical protein [Candidatus Eisenbacteria bacterium]MCC7141476.1 hypothetical protein [Candidatus Eisenbacteria bacterium]